MFIIGFIYPVSFSLHYGTSFCYGTLLILFSMLFISVTKSYCVSCLLNTLSLALDLYEIHSVFSSSLLHFFGLHLYIYNCICCPHVKYIVFVDQCMDWNLYNEHKKVWNFFICYHDYVPLAWLILKREVPLCWSKW